MTQPSLRPDGYWLASDGKWYPPQTDLTASGQYVAPANPWIAKQPGWVHTDEQRCTTRITRLAVRYGLVGVLSGYHYEKALNDAISTLNTDGYRPSFVVRKQWGMARWAGAMILATCTIGMVVLMPPMFVMSECR